MSRISQILTIFFYNLRDQIAILSVRERNMESYKIKNGKN